MSVQDLATFPYVSAFIFVVGICFGSFFNVLADRLPDNKWPTGRSKCDHCGKILTWTMLFPVLSYVIGKGESLCCRKKLSAWYPVSEILTGVIFIGVWVAAGSAGWSTVETGLYYVISSSFIVILIADMKYHIIPDVMTLIFAASAFILLMTQEPHLLVIHMAGGFLLFGLLYILHIATHGKGMGFGDVKFAFPMGMLLGPLHGFLALYISFMMGGIYGTIALLSGNKKLKSSIAFGPFLIVGTVIMVVWGEEVWELIRLFLS